MHIYMLDENGEAKQTSNIYEWASWYTENRDRLITKRTEVRNKFGKIKATVVTRFSGQVEYLTHPPLVWVTEVVGTIEIHRLASRKAAEADHDLTVEIMKKCYCK